MSKTVFAATYVIGIVVTVTGAGGAEDAEEKVGYLGIVVRNPPNEMVKGPYASSVAPNSPAEQAGIRKHDVILAVGDTPIPDDITYIEKIASLSPGEMVRLTVWRKGKEIPITATLGSRPLFNTKLSQKDPPRVLGGTIDGGGMNIVGNVIGGGNVVVDDGTMRIQGRFVQHWWGLLDIQIDRRAAHAQLWVDGDVFLEGILHVGISKIEPRAGDRFELISNAKSLRGRFGKVMLPTIKDVQGKIVYDDLEKKQDLDGDGKYDVTLVFEAAKDTPK